MGLFPGMSPRMHRQGTALDEALVAVLYGTLIGALIGVYAIMATEVRLAIERLWGRGIRGGRSTINDSKTHLATTFPGAVDITPTLTSHVEVISKEVTVAKGRERVVVSDAGDGVVMIRVGK